MPKRNSPYFLQLDGIRVVVFNKSAHTSIANALSTHKRKEVQRGAKRDGVYRDTVDQVSDAWFDQNQPILTVAFVRHPLSRIVSVYNHLIVDQEYPTFDAIGFEHGMGFEDFCEHLLALDIHDCDKHLQLQASQMDKVPHVGEVWIGRVDQLEQHWQDFLAFTGLHCAGVPHYNKRAYLTPWTGYYSVNLAKMVAARFRRDIIFWKERRWPI